MGSERLIKDSKGDRKQEGERSALAKPKETHQEVTREGQGKVKKKEKSYFLESKARWYKDFDI